MVYSGVHGRCACYQEFKQSWILSGPWANETVSTRSFSRVALGQGPVSGSIVRSLVSSLIPDAQTRVSPTGSLDLQDCWHIMADRGQNTNIGPFWDLCLHRVISESTVRLNLAGLPPGTPRLRPGLAGASS